MSRQLLSLFELDRDALKVLTGELETALADNDRDGLAELLELGDVVKTALGQRERAVDFFLLPPDHDDARPLHASLRRISKKRALTKVMTSSELSLEGRMRGYEVLRERRDLGKLVDKLMSPKRLPWFLRTPGSTCGWLTPDQREQLARGMRDLRPSLTPELVELADGLDEAVGDVVLHDAL